MTDKIVPIRPDIEIVTPTGRKALTQELTELHSEGKTSRYLYVSEFENNLHKVKAHYDQFLKLHNPFGAIILCVPDILWQIKIPIDGLYIDKGLLTPLLVQHLTIGYTKEVDPTTMEILDEQQ